MDKSAKVEAAPAVVAPAKVAKKGKRDAEVAIEKNVSSKKQKRDVEAEQAALKKNVEAKTQKKPIKKQAALKKKNVESKTQKKPIKKQAFSSSDEDSSESDDEPKNAEGKTNVRPNKVPVAAAKKADSSSDDSESDDSGSDEGEKKAAPVKKGVRDHSAEEDAKKVAAQPKKTAASIGSAAATKKKDESTDDSDESSDDDVSQKPATPRAEGASKTLFVRLPYQVDRDHLVEFFEDVGEAVDVHVNVEFETEEAAQKALELIKEHELSGRGVRVDWARERVPYTQHSGKGQSIYVRGFDKSGVEDEIRRSLQEHFGSCGEITRCEIPKRLYTGKITGYAIIDFIDSGACTKALELDKSEIGGYKLCVREAYPRGWGWGGWLMNVGLAGLGKKITFDQED